MAAADEIDRAQRRFPPLGYPIAVVYKFFDDLGNFMAALFAYYAFVSLFPMLILATTILGVVLDGNPHLQRQLIDSALQEFPIIGQQIKAPSPLSGSWGSLTISTVVALYGALGAAQAFQYIANTAWQVPRNSRPNPFAARGKSLGLICLLGTTLLATIALTSVVPRVIQLQGLAGLGVQAGTVLIDVIAIAFAFRVATSRRVNALDMVPGAVFAAIMWQLLQRVGGVYVDLVVKRNSEIGGLLGVVVGLMLFLYVAGVVIAISMEINAVRGLRLWPRALLTPFTDSVELTAADIRAYSGLTEATRLKGFQHIDVTFDRSADPSGERTEHEHVELPLDFGGDDRDSAVEPLPPHPTVPMPVDRPSRQHRLPQRPAGGSDPDELATIPIVTRRRSHPDEVDDEMSDDATSEGTAGDGSVVRGPWSAGG